MKANQPAFEIGQMAEKVAQGYYTHTAAIEVARDPRAKALAPSLLPNHVVPVSQVMRKDGTSHTFHFIHFLNLAYANAEISLELSKVWLVGSLLAVGDGLSRHKYFDHAPELELLYHLRNGLAHGNRFHFTKSGLERLKKYPAHNKLAWVKSDTKFEFNISANLAGKTVLFDFMGAGDVLDLLQSVALYLIRMGNGDPLRP